MTCPCSPVPATVYKVRSSVKSRLFPLTTPTGSFHLNLKESIQSTSIYRSLKTLFFIPFPPLNYTPLRVCSNSKNHQPYFTDKGLKLFTFLHLCKFQLLQMKHWLKNVIYFPRSLIKQWHTMHTLSHYDTWLSMVFGNCNSFLSWS